MRLGRTRSAGTFTQPVTYFSPIPAGPRRLHCRRHPRRRLAPPDDRDAQDRADQFARPRSRELCRPCAPLRGSIAPSGRRSAPADRDRAFLPVEVVRRSSRISRLVHEISQLALCARRSGSSWASCTGKAQPVPPPRTCRPRRARRPLAPIAWQAGIGKEGIAESLPTHLRRPAANQRAVRGDHAPQPRHDRVGEFWLGRRNRQLIHQSHGSEHDRAHANRHIVNF